MSDLFLGLKEGEKLTISETSLDQNDFDLVVPVSEHHDLHPFLKQFQGNDEQCWCLAMFAQLFMTLAAEQKKREMVLGHAIMSGAFPMVQVSDDPEVLAAEGRPFRR